MFKSNRLWPSFTFVTGDGSRWSRRQQLHSLTLHSQFLHQQEFINHHPMRNLLLEKGSVQLSLGFPLGHNFSVRLGPATGAWPVARVVKLTQRREASGCLLSVCPLNNVSSRLNNHKWEKRQLGWSHSTDKAAISQRS